MARERGQYKAGDRVSFRISKDVDEETLAHINSIENFSEETYLLWRDKAKENKFATKEWVNENFIKKE